MYTMFMLRRGAASFASSSLFGYQFSELVVQCYNVHLPFFFFSHLRLAPFAIIH